ncbi:glutamine synthetase III [Ruminiclostridium cellulolyticum]|uniref:Glutamine synthetase catalytic region n=1 Tax=Ruminiclostridium cellulolyticum (strain ATCC 35319 / DSM 5812 / JCM 6584 / H10) TaxID=394503 RepID=B8I719_RUMCH|nr:glutamine synthetase III [Ruminiclostridium cellulolyticum]ACL74943.1 glutamine synthetase catalytic region [Ruminiclostridium cellulolyticum H10]
MNLISQIFGSNVYNDSVMRERLPKATYKALKKTIDEGLPLDFEIADVVASSMKDWAIEKGATHYTHWFQPMTGITAEKHDSFINATADGKAILEFSGRELIKGEADGSSFPSGGLRVTFEARGYTAWDCTSPAFIKNNTLYIPTAFCSYTGETLDKKTPLLRSIECLSKNAVRVLKLFGNENVTKATPTVGAEQEYFLIDKKMYDKRKDLIFTGRTLFGSKAPKGQEMDDHYYGSIKARVSSFMKDLDRELWKLGIFAKTEHNEVAPAQHELAPIFTTSNIATDHNQLIMELLKTVALKHGLVCLLHEKPFAGVNGSGKHNNWSLSTNDGQNLFDPGKTPHENVQFLLFLCAVIKAVDEYADLIRLSGANPGNDHRLGTSEAPPSIISIFLGDELTKILEQIVSGENIETNCLEKLMVGVKTLPELRKDTTDRNRTSPFAFTGNKFEFRMVGSSASIASANFFLNTAVADVLEQFADRLEKAKDFSKEVNSIIKDVVKENGRIIFNGNGYSDEWVKEAERRGLPNIKSYVEAIACLLKEKNIAVMEKQKVFSRVEMHSRYEISLEKYIKTINIEAMTMLEISKRQLLPACIKFETEIARSINEIKNCGVEVDISANTDLLKETASLVSQFKKEISLLENSLSKAQHSFEDTFEQAMFYRQDVFARMETLRTVVDELECIVASSIWPIPTYADILFNI